jgi:protein-disulfide isomerase
MPESIENDHVGVPDREEPSPELEAPLLPQAGHHMPRARLVRLGILVALVAAAIVVLTLATTAHSPFLRPSGPAAGKVEQQIGALLAGIPQHANVLGQPKAPVTLRWFGDLECPFCKQFALGALPAIVRQWVRGGQLKIEYFSMETATRDPKVFKTQEVAALAAGMQDKLWNYIETFYHEQGEEGSGYVTGRYLQGLAGQIAGLNTSLWAEDRFNPALAARVAAEMRVAAEARFTGTPSFLISRQGGRVIKLASPSLTNPKPFDDAIEYLLNGGKAEKAIPA